MNRSTQFAKLLHQASLKLGEAVARRVDFDHLPPSPQMREALRRVRDAATRAADRATVFAAADDLQTLLSELAEVTYPWTAPET